MEFLLISAGKGLQSPRPRCLKSLDFAILAQNVVLLKSDEILH